jgi:hypothetical protein
MKGRVTERSHQRIADNPAIRSLATAPWSACFASCLLRLRYTTTGDTAVAVSLEQVACPSGQDPTLGFRPWCRPTAGIA